MSALNTDKVPQRNMFGFFGGLWSSYRGFIYNLHFGNDLNDLSTPRLYQKFISQDSIKPGSKIFEVGIGSAVYFDKEYVRAILHEKNISVYGIDLDADYIKSAQELIAKVGLQDRVEVQKVDLFEFTTKESYDVILFSESAPLIPQWLMCKMVDYIKKTGLLAPGGSIVWINNIRNNPSEITRTEVLIKRYAKYVPFMNVDFGETLTRKYFDGIAEQAAPEFDLKYEVLAQSSLYALLDVPTIAWFPSTIIRWCMRLMNVRNYLVQQYAVTLKAK